MQFDRRLYEALLRSDFRAFLEKSFRTLSPGDQYVWNWHIDAIAWHLERVRRGEIKRLIINMPPRSLKSLTASVRLARVHSRPRPVAAHHLRQLFRRARAKIIPTIFAR